MNRMAVPPRPGGRQSPARVTVAPGKIVVALAYAIVLRRRGVRLSMQEGRVEPVGPLGSVQRAVLARHAPILAALLAPGRSWPAAVADTLLKAMLDRTADRFATAMLLAGIWPGSVNDLSAEEVRAWAERRDALDASLVEAREAGDLVGWAAAIEAFEAWARARIAAVRAKEPAR